MGGDQCLDRIQVKFDGQAIDAGSAFSGGFRALERPLSINRPGINKSGWQKPILGGWCRVSAYDIELVLWSRQEWQLPATTRMDPYVRT
jgi:hypothetical protein